MDEGRLQQLGRHTTNSHKHWIDQTATIVVNQDISPENAEQVDSGEGKEDHDELTSELEEEAIR